MRQELHREFGKTAMYLLKMSMRTSLCLQFEPPKMAAAAIWLATIYLELPSQPSNRHRAMASSSSVDSNSGSSRNENVELVVWPMLVEDYGREVTFLCCRVEHTTWIKNNSILPLLATLPPPPLLWVFLFFSLSEVHLFTSAKKAASVRLLPSRASPLKRFLPQRPL